MKTHKIKRNLIALVFFISNIVSAQEYYNFQNKTYTQEAKDKIVKDMRQLIPKEIEGYGYFRCNKIVEKKDSIINYGYLTLVPKNFTEEKIFRFLNQPLPQFSIEKYNGGMKTNADLKGKPTIITLWFTTCVSCVEEMPDLNILKEKFNDRLNFEAITFNNHKIVSKFLKKHNFNFEILINAGKYLELLGNDLYPKIILLDENNVVRYISSGLSSKTANGKKQSSAENLYLEIEDLINN